MTKLDNMRHVYVFDTNALIDNPECLIGNFFNDADLYIPATVLVELDRLKGDVKAQRGCDAREAIRTLDKIREYGSLAEGVILPNNNMVKVDIPNGETDDRLVSNWDPGLPDHAILKTALKLAKTKALGFDRVFLVTGDTLLSVMADSVRIRTQKIPARRNPLYSGQREVFLTEDVFKNIFTDGRSWKFLPSDLPVTDSFGVPISLEDLSVNEFLIIQNHNQPNTLDQPCDEQCCRLARFNGANIVPLASHGWSPFGIIKPRSIGQHFLLESLLVPSDEERAIIVRGPAGTGKTLLTLAAVSEQTRRRRFERFIYVRANAEADRPFGFLPGGEDDKTDWLKGPLYDNMRMLVNALGQGVYVDDSDSIEQKKKALEILNITPMTLSHMRGRTFERSFIMFEESQNSTFDQALMVGTRPGSGSVVALIGDPTQVDTYGLSEFNNGLVCAFKELGNAPLSYLLRLHAYDNHRSHLSRFFTERLKKR